MNNENDVLASSGPSAPHEAESVRQSGLSLQRFLQQMMDFGPDLRSLPTVERTLSNEDDGRGEAKKGL
jgi:hypothetical protein